MAEIYGYVRVSTREQKEDGQLADVPVDRTHICTGRASGRAFDRLPCRALPSCFAG